jgi:excinuclease ABC subunit C
MSLPALPKAPGVYFFKDAHDRILYIGKAKSIQKRVSSYFQKRNTDWKIQALLEDHASIDYILTTNETEALLLEAQLIREHKPKYNVLLKTGQPFIYLMVTKPQGHELPTFELVRNKKKKGTYVGPFLHKTQARRVYGFLINTFKLYICNKNIPNGCLDYHLGRCAGSCMLSFDRDGYIVRLQLALDVLKNDQKNFRKAILAQIETYNKSFEFEKAKHLYEYLENLDVIFHTIQTKYSEEKYEQEAFAATTPARHLYEMGEKAGIVLQELLGTEKPIKIIDCFDISHFQSSFLTGACVRFAKGQPDKNNFRRFKIKTLQQQNDYAALQEILQRRYKDPQTLPDLILIDGGKGQLSAAKQVLPHAQIISLAKREETIFGDAFPEGIKLDLHTDLGKLLIALRDYTHHFAISYHRLRRQRESYA